MPNRIQQRRTKGWRMPAGAISVGRPGIWGNPFPIAKGTSTSMGVTRPTWVIGTWNGPAMWFRDTKEEAIALSVAAFHAWVNQPQRATLREKAVLALRGHDLACWCHLCPEHAAGKPLGVVCEACAPCHADVLLEIANA